MGANGVVAISILGASTAPRRRYLASTFAINLASTH